MPRVLDSPEIILPLRSVPNRAGTGEYMIAAPMHTSDLVINLPDYVVMVLPGKGNLPPKLVLRVRDSTDDGPPGPRSGTDE